MHKRGISIFQTWDKRQNNEVHSKQGFKNEVHIFLKINLENKETKTTHNPKLKVSFGEKKFKKFDRPFLFCAISPSGSFHFSPSLSFLFLFFFIFLILDIIHSQEKSIENCEQILQSQQRIVEGTQ